MSAPAIAVGPDTELAEAAGLMAQKKLGSLPVTDRGRVIGMITETDLLRHVVGVNACCADVEPSWCPTRDDRRGHVYAATYGRPG